MQTDLGSVIKDERKRQHLTQKQLATGICSQPMLSGIEKGTYTPNAKLLIALCNRLKISLNKISLAQNFAIGTSDNLNQRLASLCNAHDYQRLLAFLERQEVLDHIETDEQLQAYYYYHGVANFQINDSITDAEDDFKMSLTNARETGNSVLTRLGHVSLAVVEAKLGHRDATDKLVNESLEGIHNINYEEDLNIIFYLSGFLFFELQRWDDVIDIVLKGIDFATEHNSHYMLANLYHILARVADLKEEENLRNEAETRERTFAELFHEKPFDRF